jgi:uncharacterized protein YbjT (DUF2867 family)
MSRRAVVLGATGLVGGLVLARLLQRDEWQQVVVLGRRAPDISHPKLRFVAADLGRMADYAAEFAASDVFCCLGTTLRQAGSKEAFSRVDLDYCVAAAEQARSAGVERFIMISAVNANRNGCLFMLAPRVRQSGRLLKNPFRPLSSYSHRCSRGSAANSVLVRSSA